MLPGMAGFGLIEGNDCKVWLIARVGSWSIFDKEISTVRIGSSLIFSYAALACAAG